MANDSNNTIEAFLKEGELLLGDNYSVHQTHPTMHVQGADPVATIEGGSGETLCDSMPNKRLHVFFTDFRKDGILHLYLHCILVCLHCI